MSNLTNKAHYIAIDGGIGVGKTTLATKLANDLSAQLLLEPGQEIASLEGFYKNMRCKAFTTQLDFFMHRLAQFDQAQAKQIFQGVVVSDYCWDKEALFARHNLNHEEFKLYQLIVARMNISIPKPDLVVYLQAPTNVLRQRIIKGDKPYEQNISCQYLTDMCQVYTEYFHHYTDSALLIINAENIDWVNNQTDYQVLKDHIEKTSQGKHFLNFESQEN